METLIVSTDIAGNVKPSFASSSLVGLTVRANGEETTKVLDMNGNMVEAQFPTPTIQPGLALNIGSDSGFPANKWTAYVYVWAATTRYPLVENDISIGGSLAPRGQPSPSNVIQIVGVVQSIQVTVTAPPPTPPRPDIDQVWIFRTPFFDTAQEATENAAAGNCFFVHALTLPTFTYADNNPLEGTDQVELDNFGIPTFRFVIYADPYWWGWGNYPLSVEGSWSAIDGQMVVTDGTKWYPGRNGQYVRLEGVTTGGIGNNGLWLFKWIDATHGQLTLLDGTNAAPGLTASGKIVIQGPPTTLFRSKARNPFSWGWTEYFEDGTRVPQLYAFKVGGGLGTAIAEIPTVPYLLLSTEYPAGSYTLDLRYAGLTTFEKTLRTISKFYSITSHFSQFTATRQFFPSSGSQMRTEKIVLWGWDAKNFCIVETDGVGINIVSERVSKTLRRMTSNRSRQILAHGAYDAKNRMNCMWLPAEDSAMQINILIMHHAPTDQWFVHDEKDILCSAQFQDGDSNLSKIYVGTETGLLGQAFADGFFANWIASGRSHGTIGSATANSITRNDSLAFYLDRDGYVGNWCLITDQYGENEQWGRISAVNASTLTFDYIQPYIAGPATAFNPPISVSSIFHVGVIECRTIKYYDLNAPAEDKKLSEMYMTLDQVDQSFQTGHNGSTFLRYYRERSATPFAPLEDGRINIPLKRIKMDDAVGTQVWFTSIPPTERIKAFGIEVIDRGFRAWRFYNHTLKVD